jgi:hypothetical protein
MFARSQGRARMAQRSSAGFRRPYRLHGYFCEVTLVGALRPIAAVAVTYCASQIGGLRRRKEAEGSQFHPQGDVPTCVAASAARAPSKVLATFPARLTHGKFAALRQ